MNWQLDVTGYLEICLSGSNPERIINMAMSRGIYVWDIKHDAQGFLTCKIRLGGYKALRYLVRKSGCRIRIKKKHGFPFFLRRVKKRKVLLIGSLFFCLVLYILSTFVWYVDVTGNEQIPTEKILQNMEQHGLKVGLNKRTLNKDYLVERLLFEIPELSWATIHIQGTRIVIEVAEKTLQPQDGSTEPADLVARLGGRIEELLILKGTAQVNEGDLVSPGQTLIAGIYYPHNEVNSEGSISPSAEGERVRAQGLVRARVIHELEVACLLKEEIIQDTGREAKVVLLSWQGGDIVLYGKRTVPFAKYRQIKETKTLYNGRILKGPVELTTIIYREQDSQIKEWGLEGAYQEAVRRARQHIAENLPSDCRIISENAEPIPTNEEDLLKINYTLETVEDIGSYTAPFNQGME